MAQYTNIQVSEKVRKALKVYCAMNSLTYDQGLESLLLSMGVKV